MKKIEVQDLLTTLEPVKPISHPIVRLLKWLLPALIFNTLVFNLLGSFRPYFGHDLTSNPRFFLETLSAFSPILFLGILGTMITVPGYRLKNIKLILAFTPMVFYLGSIVWGMSGESTLFPSRIGKRPHCALEILSYSAAINIPYLLMVKRGFLIKKGWAAFIVAASSAAIPTAMMQVACMYSPKHNLQFHVIPFLLSASVGCTVGWFILKKRVG